MPSDVAPLVVEKGVIRLVRKMAAFAYGKRDVTWPEDYEGPEKQLQDDRVFGYVAALPGGERLGLSARRFVRADVQIDAVDKWSNVERVLDDAAARTGGEVFVESLITGRGLGRQVPGVDFRVGDRVPARVAGRVLPGQLVTAVEWHDGEPAGKLGGQEWQNAQARQDRNDGVLRQIANERRQRERALAQEAERRAQELQREADQRDLALALESQARIDALLEQKQWVATDFRTGVLESVDEKYESTKKTVDRSPWEAYQDDIELISRKMGGSRQAQSAFSESLWQQSSLIQQMRARDLSVPQMSNAFAQYNAINTALWANQVQIDATQDEMIEALNLGAVRFLVTGVKSGGDNGFIAAVHRGQEMFISIFDQSSTRFESLIGVVGVYQPAGTSLESERAMWVDSKTTKAGRFSCPSGEWVRVLVIVAPIRKIEKR